MIGGYYQSVLAGDMLYLPFTGTGFATDNKQYVSLAGLSGLTGRNSTVEFWVQILNPAYHPQGIVFFGTNTGGSLFYQWTTGTTFYIAGQSLTLPAPLPLTTMTHLACVTTDTQIQLYVNGGLYASRNVAITPYATGVKNFNIGRWIGSTNLQHIGYLDEFRVWNVARSAAEIAANYHKRLTTATGLLLNMGFSSNLSDASGQGNHGTKNGILQYRKSTVPFS